MLGLCFMMWFLMAFLVLRRGGVIALLLLCSFCLVAVCVLYLFLVVPVLGLWSVIVAFSGHIHLFLMRSRLFIAALWSPAGKGQTSWLLLVMFIVFCYFPICYPGLGVVLDCIVSCSLLYFVNC